MPEPAAADVGSVPPEVPPVVRRQGGRGWYFPEMEGPDLSDELVPGERAFWDALDTKTIDQIYEEVLGPDEPSS